MADNHFAEELNNLRQTILKMGHLVEASIGAAIDALVNRDTEKLPEVFSAETQINDLHILVDEICLKLLALQQPKASDLRLIMAAIKINSDLERMGDQAVNIAQNTKLLLAEPPLKPYVDIPKMASLARQMVKDCLDAFIHRDVTLADVVVKQDDELDNLKTKIFHDFLDLMIKTPNTVSRGLDVILIARNLERIGDHATNVAEDVIFMVLGKDIRHPGRMGQN